MKRNIQDIDPILLKQWLDCGEATLIDVREKMEYATSHIPGAALYPLSSFDPAQLALPEGKRVVFYCAAGRRSDHAAAKWLDATSAPIAYNLHGGIIAWQHASYPTIVDQREALLFYKHTFTLLGAALLVSLLLALLTPWFLIATALFSLSLLLAGSTEIGHALMAILISLVVRKLS